MAVVNVTVNGRVYDIACDDSQAARVQQLGREVDDRAQKILGQVGAVADARLLVMLALWLADELSDTKDELKRLNEMVEGAAAGDESLAMGIESLAARIEGIAERLERA